MANQVIRRLPHVYTHDLMRYVGKASSMAGNKIMKGDTSIPFLKTLLRNIGLPHILRRIKRFITKISKFPGGLIIGIALNSIPIIIAMLQDRGIGKSTLSEIGIIMGDFGGDAIGSLTYASIGGTIVPLVCKIGTVLGLGITKIMACTIVGSAFCGVGAIIGAGIGSLLALGASALIFSAYRRAIESSFPCQKTCLRKSPRPKISRRHELTRKQEPKLQNSAKRVPRKRELEKLPPPKIETEQHYYKHLTVQKPPIRSFPQKNAVTTRRRQHNFKSRQRNQFIMHRSFK